MRQETIDKLKQLPGDYDFNWQLFDSKGELTIDYLNIFNADDFETLFEVFEDKEVWTESIEMYNSRAENGKLTECHNAHAWRTLALYQHKDIVNTFLDISKYVTDDCDVYWEDFNQFFVLFSEDEKVFERLVTEYTPPTTAKNQRLQGVITNVFASFYHKKSKQQQDIIENLLIAKIKDNGDAENLEQENEDKYQLNGFIYCDLLKLGFDMKYYETFKELFEKDYIYVNVAGDLEDLEIDLGMREKRTYEREFFPNLLSKLNTYASENILHIPSENSPKSNVFVSKSDQKKKKSKRKTEKKARKKNRK